MGRLANSLAELKPHYSVVVVGSGYGGAIAASRLARAGQKVCVLERGNELQPGEYPNTPLEADRDAQWDTPLGHIGSPTALYDFRINDDLNVFVGCGLGGTSLVNANVAIRPDPRVLADTRWPQAFRDDLGTRVESGFVRAEEMLRPSRYPDSFPTLPKLVALEKAAAGIGEPFRRVPLNVNFTVSGTNHVGVEQKPCNLCGDCVSGCNHSAKNTLITNYLPDAKNFGAEIYCGVGVRRLRRENGRWLVYFQLADLGREGFHPPEMFLSADIVVLSAGSLGSTEILLRSREDVRFSERLGAGFTGNGDVLAFAYDCKSKVNGIGYGERRPKRSAPVGPCITGVIDTRHADRPVRDGLIIEEGSIPGAIADLASVGVSAAAGTLPGEAMGRTLTYLVMSHDDEDDGIARAGQLTLRDDRPRIDWPGLGSKPHFERVDQRLAQATQALGGRHVANPLWSELFNNRLVTVHPLGGCNMAERAEEGVVNDRCQVFSGATGSEVHAGLYVCDGSVIPTPLGANPLLTISAVSERCCELIARDHGWKIDHAFPPVAKREDRGRPLGLRFTERMSGDDFEFTLSVVIENLDELLGDPNYPGTLVGTAICPALSRHAMTVTGGTFRLGVPDPTRVNTHLMLYRMTLSTDGGKRLLFDGYKLLKASVDPTPWSDTTRLFFTIRDGETDDAPIIKEGVLAIAPDDLLVQVSTLQAVNARDLYDAKAAELRFQERFAAEIIELYRPLIGAPRLLDPDAAPRKKRPLKLGRAEVHDVVTSDKARLRLTRFAGGKKGPVILAPGVGTTTLAYLIDTVDVTLTEFLFARGYDVWLFDYRGSPAVAASQTQFTLDDIAMKDFPAAVDRVRQVTGAKSVQVLGHCVASATLLMSLLGGLQGVRSAICSQFSAFPEQGLVQQIKAHSRLADLLPWLAINSLTPHFGRTIPDWTYDALLRLYPTYEQCDNPVCRRILFMYGEVYRHQQLNEATHRAIHEMFGLANMKTFQHLTRMIRRARAVDFAGDDSYLPKVKTLGHTRIALLQGADNALFLPSGAQRTYEWLCENNGSERYSSILVENYGHMDCFIGRDASRDVFPKIVDELELLN